MLIYKSETISVDDSSCAAEELAGSEPGDLADAICLHCRKTRRKLRKVLAFLRAHLKLKRHRQSSSSSSSSSSFSSATSLSSLSSTLSSSSSSTKPKKFVLFDLGGVIVTPPQQALLKYCDEVGLPRNFIYKVISQGRANNVFGRLETGRLTVSQFAVEFEKECRRVAHDQGVDFPERFNAADMIRFKDPDLIPEMLNAVAVLRKHGIKTCVLTNNYIDDTPNRSYAAGGLTAFSLYFDEIVESCRLGIRKPDPEIFQEALRRIGAESNQTVFLDDSELNTRAADSLGISTILVQDTNEALEQLKISTGIDVFKSAGPIAADPDQVMHGYVTTRSKVRFHFCELGSGPPVLLCHDFERTWASWRKQLPALALAGFRAIAVDLKGFGESSKPTDVEQYKLHTLCKEMMEFLDALGLPQVTAVGEGMGAAFVWTLAHHNTDRIRAVAGINTMPPALVPALVPGLVSGNPLKAFCASRRTKYHLPLRRCVEIERFFRIAVHLPINTIVTKDETGLEDNGGMELISEMPLVGRRTRSTLRRLYKASVQKSQSFRRIKSKSQGYNWFRNNEANSEWSRQTSGRNLLIPALEITSGEGSSKNAPDAQELHSWITDLDHKHIADCELKTEDEKSLELNTIVREWLRKVHHGEHVPLLPM